VQPRADGAESVHARPNLDLSEEVFAEAPATEPEASESETGPFEVPTEESGGGEADATGAGNAAAPVEEEPLDAAEPNAVPTAGDEPPASQDEE
jgi:hypothetical protein